MFLPTLSDIMGPGLYGLYVAINFLRETPQDTAETQQKKQKKRLSLEKENLSSSDLALVNSLATTLLSKYIQDAKSDYFAVTIREAKSWKPVKDMLIGFEPDDNEGGPGNKKTKWKQRWIKRIEDMTSSQNTFFDSAQLLKKTKTDDKKRPILKTMTVWKKIIANHVKAARIELSNDLHDKVLNADTVCKGIIEYIRTNWPGLTVFSDWPEVRMNDERLAFRVRPPTADELAKLQADRYSLLSNDLAEKAFIITKRIDNELKVEDYEFAPDAAVPPAMKRKASSVQLEREEYTEVAFVEDDKTAERMAASKLPSSMGDHYHYLFGLVRSQVSLDLAEITGAEEGGQAKTHGRFVRKIYVSNASE